MTPARAAILLEALRDGETMTGAAERAGISRRTAYRYTERDAEFGEQVKEALETGRRTRARRRGKHTRLRTAGYRLVPMSEAAQQP
ncbi:helix-turn-helix domain-containing protein [Streptomyces sp. NPDC001793]|uniref:helix-turn-helix domain-containing protein n=1 Tax=Streptomyces sp. NPDC001793 TaxID=3154657 RepID=UPI00331D8878